MPNLPLDLTDYDETDLAYSVLRRIAPDEHGNWLRIAGQEHRQLMQLMQKEVTFLLNLDSDVPEAQKRQMATNTQALLQYLA